MYILKDDSKLIISEPLPELDEFKKLYYITNTITSSNNIKLNAIDYTNDAKDFLKFWIEGEMSTSNKIEEDKCECCLNKKKCITVYATDKFWDDEYHDRCFQCGVKKSLRVKMD